MLKLMEDRHTRDIIKPSDKTGNAAKADSPAAAKPESPAKDAAPPVVDRQLQAALTYLSSELAKAP